MAGTLRSAGGRTSAPCCCRTAVGYRSLEVTDPQEIARAKAQDERHRRKTEWLQAHWPDVSPQACGKFLAVAGQEAFVADTLEEAWAWAKTTHPEDNGAIVRYIRTEKGPRIYVDR